MKPIPLRSSKGIVDVYATLVVYIYDVLVDGYTSHMVYIFNFSVVVLTVIVDVFSPFWIYLVTTVGC